MSPLLDRFRSRDAQVEAMMRQRIIMGMRAPAEALVDAGTLVSFVAGEEFITQGEYTSDAFFLLAGSVEIRVGGRLIPYGRTAGEVVGEFSAINSALARTATIHAAEAVVALKCDSGTLRGVANGSPAIWEQLAIDLTRKIEQRNRFISACNAKPFIFMIAAEEQLEAAEGIALALGPEFDTRVWSDEDLFPPGSYELEVLNRAAHTADFAVVLAHPDDLRRRKDRQGGANRESILFELGYLMPMVGQHRTIILVPEDACGSEPLEFKGVRPWCYREPAAGLLWESALAPTVRRLRNYVKDVKTRSRLEEGS